MKEVCGGVLTPCYICHSEKEYTEAASGCSIPDIGMILYENENGETVHTNCYQASLKTREQDGQKAKDIKDRHG